MNNIKYYLIRERLLGKEENNQYYLFKNNEWVIDENNVIFNHLIGFDPFEPEDSPYCLGSGSIMDEIEIINEDEAMKFIKRLK